MENRRFVLGLSLFIGGTLGVISLILYLGMNDIISHSTDWTLFKLMILYELDFFLYSFIVFIIAGLILAISTLKANK